MLKTKMFTQLLDKALVMKPKLFIVFHSPSVCLILFFLFTGISLPVMGSAPIIPADFDQRTVEQLIQNIEQGPNAAILKTGYYGSYKAPTYPIEQGLMRLQKFVEHQVVGTPRWYVSQSVLAYAQSHNGADSDKVRSCYHVIFSTYESTYAHAKSSKKTLNPMIVKAIQRSVYELVSMMPSHDQAMGVRTTDLKKEKTLLLEALRTYLVLLRQNKPYKAVIPWKEAIANLQVSTEAAQLIEAALKNDPIKSREFYLLSSEILSLVSRSRSDEILHLAQKLSKDAEVKVQARINKSS